MLLAFAVAVTGVVVAELRVNRHDRLVVASGRVPVVVEEDVADTGYASVMRAPLFH